MPKTQIKICGVKTKEALEAAVKSGASFIGFNFYRPSPRYITPEAAGALAQRVPSNVKIVAVTVDPDNALLESIFKHLSPDMIQLHGRETPQRVGEIKSRYKVPVIKAFGISTAEDFAALKPYAGVADWFLFEGKPPANATLPGGNAASFDWKLLQGRSFPQAWLLAGGLNAKNLKEALALSGASCVDISSGVERAPGEKDAGMITEIFRAVS